MAIIRAPEESKVDKVQQKLSTAAKCMDMAIVWYGQLQVGFAVESWLLNLQVEC